METYYIIIIIDDIVIKKKEKKNRNIKLTSYYDIRVILTEIYYYNETLRGVRSYIFENWIFNKFHILYILLYLSLCVHFNFTFSRGAFFFFTYGRYVQIKNVSFALFLVKITGKKNIFSVYVIYNIISVDKL